MLSGEKVIVKNGLKKSFTVYKNIRPEFSAIHTKLCADGMELEEELIYLLGNGYTRSLEDGMLKLFNSTFIGDLCSCMGIYLEEFEYTNEQKYFEEVKRNSAINIAPPMIYVKFVNNTYLAIVCKVHDNHTYDIISPVDKKIVTINGEQINYLKPWYMMNSPRFMKPVFREKEEMIKCAEYKMIQTNYQLKIRKDAYFNFNREDIANEIIKLSEKQDFELQTMFLESVKYIEAFYGYLHLLSEHREKLQSLWKTLYEEIEEVSRKRLAVQILEYENEVWNWIYQVLGERKYYA